jgi:hypothetical protein
MRGLHSRACVPAAKSRVPAAKSRVLAAVVVSGIAGAVLAGPLSSMAVADPPPPVQDWTRTETRADCTNYNPLRQPFFGETHIHTKYSADAVLARTRNDPYDAYRFAKGGPSGIVGLPPFDAMDVPLRTAQIDRPLDFTAVTDHSEGFGEARICLNAGYSGYNAQLCQDLRDTFDNNFQPTNPLPTAFQQFFFALILEEPARFPNICGPGPGYADCVAEAGLVWQDTQDAAEAHYDRTSACTFTTFNAYEWSGQPNGNNLHRNIIFRNDEVPALPISYYEKPLSHDMRLELKSQCIDAPGNCDVLAIPHNSNMAQDKMFDIRDDGGGAMTAPYAALRAELERIMEITQVKGDSECRDGVIGTTDELCRFENNTTPNIIAPKQVNDALFSPFAYARGGLRRGLRLEQTTGINPFALGFVGSTDSHNGTAGAVSEVDYGRIGQTGIADSSPAFILADATTPSKVELNPGGLAVVWAEENSRDAIFAAMRRRETYSTSGTRPIVRVFGGHPPLDLCDNPELDFVEDGYDTGVPMGGDMGPDLGKKSPRIAIFAQKDPGGLATPLQRAQVIKGWIDSEGLTHEVVYDVAGDPDNGAGVDLDTCAETGTGFDTLCTVWSDPDFKATEKAFYYVRIVENPTCRWHKRLCNNLKTCSTVLTSCTEDLTRTCTTDAECEAADPGQGSTCTNPYPAICVNDDDCEILGAGTCGATPAVDCDNPGSVPPAAAECCDQAGNSWTIQERAVASPIYYHPDRAGLNKGKIGFKEPSLDKLQLEVLIPDAPAALDPATTDLTLTLRDEATVWTATIPAGTMEVKKPGASYSYKDKTGAIAGITGLSVKISKGSAKIKLKTAGLDLSGLTRESQTLWVDFVSGAFSATMDRRWTFKDPKMQLSK